jgi:hypothetical protein
MSEFIKWARPSGLPITLKNTENLTDYAERAGWKLANDVDHESVILGMDDKKEIEQYVIDVCGVDINIQGKLNTVQKKAIKAIRGGYDNSATNS